MLLSTDGSELAWRTAASAVACVRERGAQIVEFSAMVQCASRHLGEIQRKCAQAGVACRAIDTGAIEFDFPGDEPHEAIIRAAEHSDCDLIFMAVPVPVGLHVRLLGRQAQKVAAGSRIAVWIASGDCAPLDDNRATHDVRCNRPPKAAAPERRNPARRRHQQLPDRTHLRPDQKREARDFK